MERLNTQPEDDSSWATNAHPNPNRLDAAGNEILGTPKEQNWIQTVTLTPTSTPTATPATAQPLSILINEIAWAGTAASSSDEWIELYNPGETPVSLEGWHLTAEDGAPDIALSGSIAAGGYFLLERTDDSTVSDIPADEIYSGSLSNSGEVLKLLAPDGTIADTANRSSTGWAAGSASPDYASMERRGVMEDSPDAWMTNNGTHINGKDADGNPIRGTPRQPNWAASVTPTPTSPPSPTHARTLVPTSTPTAYPRQTVILNEILPRAGHDWNDDGSIDVLDEYIEIVNIGEEDISLEGWKLDDMPDSGSAPYEFPDVTLPAGGHLAIFGSTSHISLSDGGDTVRLLKSGGAVADVFTYPGAVQEDEVWCRLPDGAGWWNSACAPTPAEENARKGAGARASTDSASRGCTLPDTVPQEIRLAECASSFARIWNQDWGQENAEGRTFSLFQKTTRLR